MGLKKYDYMVKNLGVVVPAAYAQITDISIDDKGNANAIFEIQRNRESIANFDPYDIISYFCTVNKSFPVYEQVYQKAKKDIFSDWEDDIIEVK